MSGPVPKDPKLKQRRNKDTSSAVLGELSAAEKKKTKVPDLPKRKGNRKWMAQAVEFWEDIWRSPMSAEFHDSDRHQLYILVELVDEFWRTPSTSVVTDSRGVKKRVDNTSKKQSLANEIRLQRACFGLTPIDRRRLQWEIERGESAADKSRARRNAGRKTQRHEVDPRSLMDGVN